MFEASATVADTSKGHGAHHALSAWFAMLVMVLGMILCVQPLHYLR